MNIFKLLMVGVVLVVATFTGSAQATSNNQFIDIIKINKAAVVVVTVEQTAPTLKNNLADTFDDLKNFGFPKKFLDGLTPDEQNEEAPPRKMYSFGTGFFIEDYIVTNYHVIAGGEKIVINFENDPTRYEVEILNSDQISDIAILKLKTPLPFNVVPLKWSNAQLHSGQDVWAIGHPRGLNYSISKGIISNTHRAASNNWQQSIQTDVAINQGNSGGPMFNMSGEVIAINTIIVTASGGSNGISVSIESKYAQSIIKKLLGGGKIDRPLMGIQIASNTMTGEVFVAIATKGKPGNLAGVKSKDIFYELDGDRIFIAQDIFEVLRRHDPGDTIISTFIRGNDREYVTMEITLNSLIQALEEYETEE